MQPALTGSSRDCVEFRPSSAGLGPPGGGASSSAGLLSTKCKRRCRALSIVRLRARGPSQEGHSQHLSHSFSDDELELTVEDSRKVFCYGCGVKLQTTQPGEMGYIEPEKYATKLEHRQYTQMLCERCISLCHGKMVPAVDDRHQKNLSFASSIDATSEKEPAPKVLIAPEELRRQLKASLTAP
ncbi:unnamed protein product [Ostreobium quekettii]|uniref:Uncharacterized protein n=1 Tax=Ostreobium quekettii TaxID=121088 RepID=A0A8S1ISE8_9CHLO|nr:unnamed protein product [Ostreobium quekettii]